MYVSPLERKVRQMKQRLIFSAILLIGTVSNAAFAEDWYAGGTFGKTTVDTGISAVSGATLDEDDTGSSFFIGTKLDDSFSIEGFYTDFGEASLAGDNGDTFVLDGTTYTFNTSATIKYSGSTMGAAGRLHFNMTENLQGFVKGGIHWWDVEAAVTTATASANATDEGSDIIMGIGMDYQIGENLALLVGYDKYTVDSEDITFLGGGIRFDF